MNKISNKQEQPFTGESQNSCSEKNRKPNRKAQTQPPEVFNKKDVLKTKFLRNF